MSSQHLNLSFISLPIVVCNEDLESNVHKFLKQLSTSIPTQKAVTRLLPSFEPSCALPQYPPSNKKFLYQSQTFQKQISVGNQNGCPSLRRKMWIRMTEQRIIFTHAREIQNTTSRQELTVLMSIMTRASWPSNSAIRSTPASSIKH